MEIRDYIASQVTFEGLDELQRMALASALSLNIALDGPPGVGKTQSVFAFAKIAGTMVHEKGCSEDTTENQIIGFPRLVEENGATVTAYENGPLAKAMEEGSIFYGDEFNLLRRDKQKRLNSAFDDRRRISRADDVEIAARSGFLGIISYNPTRALSVQDLEDSVADRFVHFHYKYMSAKIEAYIGALKSFDSMASQRPAADAYGIKLEKRAIVMEQGASGRALRFLLYLPDKKVWVNFFSGTPENGIKRSDNTAVGVYYAHRGQERHLFNSARPADETAIAALVQDFSLKVSALFNVIRQMASHGSSALPANVKSIFSGMGEMGQVVVHLPSLRIQSAAVSHLVLLAKMGMDPRLAANYAAELVVNQVCYGKYRERKNGEFANYEIISALAESFGLLIPREATALNTGFNKKVAKNA